MLSLVAVGLYCVGLEVPKIGGGRWGSVALGWERASLVKPLPCITMPNVVALVKLYGCYKKGSQNFGTMGPCRLGYGAWLTPRNAPPHMQNMIANGTSVRAEIRRKY